MRVLVSGGLGFIGSHLADKLVEDGHLVTVFDCQEDKGHPFRNPRVDYCTADIACPTTTEMSNWMPKPDVIFHLAAISRIQTSFEDMKRTHAVNVTGTVHMLQVAKKFGSKFIFAGTSCCDGDPNESPYAFSKHVGEEYCQLHRKLYNVRCSIARFYNVYGPRHAESGPLSTIVGIFERQWRNKEPFTIVGDGEQRRDFIHVKDIVSGLISIAESPVLSTFRLGTGTCKSINELASLFKPQAVEFLPNRPGEMRQTKADLHHTTQTLSWKAKETLEDYVSGVIGEDSHTADVLQ